MKFFRLLFLLLFVVFTVTGLAQYKPMSSSLVKKSLKKIAKNTTVLYIAAHPDDENTGLLAYLENVENCRTVYLSLTRGEGGQNLIGTEQGTELGLIRTEELLKARSIDGAEQRFTRAFDFGFSKSPQETFMHWDKETLLKDVVRQIRLIQPDIIITRFPVTGEGGHGQHTASAILAVDAFTKAADPLFYPAEFTGLPAWKTKSIYNNAWLPLLKQMNIDPGTLPKISINSYLPELGKTINEIAAESRSQHKCQAMGTSVNWNSTTEYLIPLAGATKTKDIFNLSENSNKELQSSVNELLAAQGLPDRGPFIAGLIKLYNKLPGETAGNYFKELAGKILLSAAGIRTELVTSSSFMPDKGNTAALLQFTSEWPVTISYESDGDRPPVKKEVRPYDLVQDSVLISALSLSAVLPDFFPERKNDCYAVSTNHNVSVPGEQIQYPFRFTVAFRDAGISVPLYLEWKRTEPAVGEIKEPLRTMPGAVISPLLQAVYTTANTVSVPVTVMCFTDIDTLALFVTNTQTTPQQTGVLFGLKKGETRQATLTLISPAVGSILYNIVGIAGKDTFTLSRTDVKYEHIPHRVYLHKAELTVTRPEMSKQSGQIAYLQGSGDFVPQALQSAGYTVNLITEADLDTLTFANYKCIIAGIRAYNTHPKLKEKQQLLNNYINSGGRYIVQYQTADKNLNGVIGPFPFSLSTERVTEEDAAPEFNPADFPFSGPLKITTRDFNGWVQERGLYFASAQDQRYLTPLQWNDKGETPKKGGLIWARHGKGVFVYTGISFFRQLPAGNEGALRILVNLIEAQP